MKNKLIEKIVKISHTSKEGHIGSSLSILDLLYVIYKKIKTTNDFFILSKGHASLGLYVVLDYFGLLNEPLENFCKYDSLIGGHPSNKIENVLCSTGSLGHGLPIGVGIALSEKIKNTDKSIYVIIGDGESNEGTIWESALLAANHKLNNLYCIMDYNKSNNRAVNLFDIKKKFESFNWDCIEIDGHDQNQILEAINKKSEKPIFILANTVKGCGVSFIENNPEWHHKYPNDEELKKIIKELKL